MSSMSNEKIPKAWECRGGGTVHDQRIQRTQTPVLTWKRGFRKIL